MNKKLLFLLTAAGCILFLSANAMALGVGGYLTVGGGAATYSFNQFDFYTSKSLTDSTNTALGGGFVLDTNCGGEGLFNYRLKIGGERNWVEREAEMSLARFHLQNVFGFGVVRHRMVRFWIGPTLGCSYTWGKRNDERYFVGLAIPNILWYQSNPLSSILSYNPTTVFDLIRAQPLLRDKVPKIAYGGIDFGFVLGLNINVVENLTFGPEFGFKYGFNWGSQDRQISWYVPTQIYYIVPINYGESNKDLSMNGYEFYLNFSVMYRMGS